MNYAIDGFDGVLKCDKDKTPKEALTDLHQYVFLKPGVFKCVWSNQKVGGFPGLALTDLQM